MKKDYKYWAKMHKIADSEVGRDWLNSVKAYERAQVEERAMNKNNKTWKRLTEERFDKFNVCGQLYSYIFRNYELEYMVLPEGDWTKVRNFDCKIQNNVLRKNPKVVYRFREKQTPLDLAWDENCFTLDVKHVFAAGFKAGQDAKH